MNALVLRGDSPELAALWPPNSGPEDALETALAEAMTRHETVLLHWLDSPPQTNEVRRAAVLIAAGHWLAQRVDLPFVLSELGAAGGLNMMWDRFRLDLPDGTLGPADSPVRLAPDWRGPCPPAALVRIADRRGVDLNPLNTQDPEDALRLLSYIWADQHDRIARTRAAIALAQATVDRGDAAAWLEARLATPRPGALHLVYHTIAWQYFPEDTKARCRAALTQAGTRATTEAPLAHLSMEADEQHGKGAVIELTLWPGGARMTLGRVDFHGRWVDWRAPGRHSEHG
ncbi:MAG: hypothetical protein CSA74_12715 [Rhodobacterales bacterium]|nr:MAG: hypothetical protein CSA74_12715 [Rhodobacterales bacterium]